ncbi:hypothetical protein LXA43DRAFT_896161 [Ganoderma leucocontextum]|nr:hypothetical protein LXA43DRAFT_896161 [Ganoderma leucocontextum]
MACASAARFLAALGITDFSVYGIATFGSKAVCCYVVDEFRPEYQFDISEDRDVCRYAEFLSKVEEAAPKLAALFEAVKQSLLERIRSEEGRASLCWTLQSQLVSRTAHR